MKHLLLALALAVPVLAALPTDKKLAQGNVVIAIQASVQQAGATRLTISTEDPTTDAFRVTVTHRWVFSEWQKTYLIPRCDPRQNPAGRVVQYVIEGAPETIQAIRVEELRPAPVVEFRGE